MLVSNAAPTFDAKLGFGTLPFPLGEVGMLLGMTGKGIVQPSPIPSPESRLERLSISPEGRGKHSAFSLVEPKRSVVPAKAGIHLQRGFSLVELSIVLVILGLLVGGVLSGQSLIRAAELRAVSSEYSRYNAAVHAFRDKYFALPGDMNNATRFWGRMNANADCVTSSSSAVASTGACDGNSNGAIDYPAAPSQSGEMYQFWRELALAGLIEGTFTGLDGGSNPQLAGVNVPKSRLSNAAWYVNYNIGFAGDANAYAGSYLNFFGFGSAISGGPYDGVVLKPEEAWNIDTKLDDGKPGTGKLLARYWNNACATSTSNTDYAGNYKLNDSSVRCSLYFINLW